MDNDTKQFIQAETEKLATMIANGFAAVDKRFADVHIKMDKGFAEANARLDRIENRHVNRLEHLESDVHDLKRDVREVQERLGIPR